MAFAESMSLREIKITRCYLTHKLPAVICVSTGNGNVRVVCEDTGNGEVSILLWI